MAYDFTAAINAAKAVVERSSGSQASSDYKYPLVYPQPGSVIVVRPLFNPASGQILRLINRHEKVACYRTYNMECPICKVQQSVIDMSGQDPFGRQKSSKSRGLCFAQFISSTVPLKTGSGANERDIAQGETILFMFPWSVYQQINAMIQGIGQTPTGMDQAFCHSQSGLFVQVTVSNDGKYTYTTTQIPYMTFPNNKTDEEFMQYLDGMESLYEQVLPSTITEEVSKQVTEYENEIYKQYIAPRVPNVGVPAGTVPQSLGQVQIPTTNPTPAVSTTAPYVNPIPAQTLSTSQTSSGTTGHPECYGKHQDGSPQCICCPDEITCMQSPI